MPARVPAESTPHRVSREYRVYCPLYAAGSDGPWQSIPLAKGSDSYEVPLGPMGHRQPRAVSASQLSHIKLAVAKQCSALRARATLERSIALWPGTAAAVIRSQVLAADEGARLRFVYVPISAAFVRGKSMHADVSPPCVLPRVLVR